MKLGDEWLGGVGQQEVEEVSFQFVEIVTSYFVLQLGISHWQLAS